MYSIFNKNTCLIGQPVLNKILTHHKDYLKNSNDGNRGYLNVLDMVGLSFFELKSLSEITILGSNLTNCLFSGATINNSNLERSVFIGCDFSDASLVESNIKYSTFINCDFSNINLVDCDLACSSFNYCEFLNADMSRAKLYSVGFSNCNLAKTNLTDVDLFDTSGDGFRIKTINVTNRDRVTSTKINYTKDRIQIMTENHSIEEWMSFSNEKTKLKSIEVTNFWFEYRDYILKTIELNPCI